MTEHWKRQNNSFEKTIYLENKKIYSKPAQKANGKTVDFQITEMVL